MNKVSATFEFEIDHETFEVQASCSDVDAYEAYDLKLKIFDESGERVYLPSAEVFEELETLAYEALYESKYFQEVY